MSNGVVSRAEYERMETQLANSRARARNIAQEAGWRPAVATVAGGAAAAVIDAKFGEGTATTVGVGAAVIGVWMRNPDLVHAAVGALIPSVYRYSLSTAKGYFEKAAPAPAAAAA